MKTEYSIPVYGTEFISVAPYGEQVGVYPTQEAARQAIERCKAESMNQTAKILVDNYTELTLKPLSNRSFLTF